MFTTILLFRVRANVKHKTSGLQSNFLLKTLSILDNTKLFKQIICNIVSNLVLVHSTVLLIK